MKKIILSLLSFFTFFSIAFGAGSLDHFDVKVNPNPVKINKSADLTIRAMDKDGNVVKDYWGDVMILIEGDYKGDNASLPNDGIYFFEEQDQWTKTFSKGLSFSKKGEPVVKIESVDKQGKTKVKVLWKNEKETSGDVSIKSPVDGSTEKSQSVSVAGETSLSNSPVVMYLNGEKVKETMSDGNGSFTENLQTVSKGDNILQVRVQDMDGEVLAKSKEISFKYEPKQQDYFKSLNVIPSKTVNTNESITIQANTIDNIDSAKLKLTNYESYDMEKINGGFEKKIQISDPGSYEISLELTKWDKTKKYDKIDVINISQKRSIEDVRFEKIAEKDSKIKMQWQFKWQVPKFKVEYGGEKGQVSELNKKELVKQNEKIVTENKMLFEDIDKDKNYFVKITPLDTNEQPKGNPSDIVIMDVSMPAASCQVKNISVTTKKMEDGNYYLTWGDVSDAKKYIIYKSDKKTNTLDEMEKVGETSETKFKYPFDPDAEELKYNYYTVQAKCKDNTKTQIDGIKKVKVGPVSSAMMLVLFSLLIYLIFKLYNYSR